MTCEMRYQRALYAIRKLHEPQTDRADNPIFCKHCSDEITVAWPCETVQIVDQAIGAAPLHPFRDCGVFEFDEEGREWPVCGNCGEALDDPSHDGFIPLGAVES